MHNLQRKVLIIGGGFGGIKTALELSKHKGFDITLLSDQPDFRYYPTLFHAATGGKATASAIPLSEIFAGKNVRVVVDRAKHLERHNSCVIGASGEKYPYEGLILALGVVSNFFGIEGLEQYAYGIKSLEEATKLRDHLHQQLTEAGRPDLNYVIIGAGPTGVELAGALPSYLKKVMDWHRLPHKKIHIDLVEAADRVMPRMSTDYSRALKKRLQKLGIKVMLKQAVKAETPDALEVGEHDIASHSVIWTAGVTNHPFFKDNHFKLTEHGKVSVDSYLQAEPQIFVIGDNADTKYSGMAQTALRDGKFVATNFARLSQGKAALAYVPKEPIYVTPAGPGWAAVKWGKFETFGRLGWLLRKAGDFRGYKDYEPWWPAAKHWLDDNAFVPNCPVCSKAHRSH
jgi:NADH dehydrogenase